ncbi:MAG: hypothetical protein M1819_001118 [Sarea resinae]|nr:MAG: hypothetical protein M1819_001118 [Sarea resinae]
MTAPPSKISIAETTRAKTSVQDRPSTSQSERRIGAPKKKPKERLNPWKGRVSVPELGAMTTVQEAGMDSPTIPGRLPVPERSSSAPTACLRQSPFGDAMACCITGPAVNYESDHPFISKESRPFAQSPVRAAAKLSESTFLPLLGRTSPSRPGIATSGRTLKEDLPPVVPPKSPRLASQSSPVRSQRITRNPPRAKLPDIPYGMPSSLRETRKGVFPHLKLQADKDHTNNVSEGCCINRGRPIKRRQYTSLHDEGNPIRHTGRTEQKPFRELPVGLKAADVPFVISPPEIDLIRIQAAKQAENFEILNRRDVEALSKELRFLDERCKDLQETYKLLRARRRSLHSSLLSYVKSPRSATSSDGGISKQVEVIAEVDVTINDIIQPLEATENRQARVRQKLLEHVAAAVTLSSARIIGNICGQSTPPQSPDEPGIDRIESSDVMASGSSDERAASRITLEGGCDEALVESIKVYADGEMFALLAEKNS